MLDNMEYRKKYFDRISLFEFDNMEKVLNKVLSVIE